ncbi:MAG: NADH-quinone oxidoreductase subunit C [bacterium]
MREQQAIVPIEVGMLVGEVARRYAEGERLVQISCTTLQSAYELSYSFDKGYRLENLRLTVAPEEPVPSISIIYPGAFLYENEIHDLFGLAIRNIAVDYRGTLYRTRMPTPFSIGNCPVPVPPKPKAEAAQEKGEAEMPEPQQGTPAE